MRETQLNVRLSEEESSRLEVVAEHFGLGGASVVRMLVKQAYDNLPAEAKKRGKKA